MASIATCVTTFEWKWQCKQQACTGKTIQTIDGAAITTMMAKQITEQHQGTSRRELMDKFHCAVLL